MHLTKEDIENKDRIERLNIINSITGIKPANMIGSIDNRGQTNLAVFSSVVHLGSHPALLGFILRPLEKVRRHTYENILENGLYTINSVHRHFTEQTHYTSAKFAKEESEFEKCNFTEEYLFDFKAPFVKESHIKIGMRHIENIEIKYNNTMMVVGEIQHLQFPDESMDEKGHLDLSKFDAVGISGLNSYYGVDKIAQYPFARPHEVPEFSIKVK